MNDLAAGIGENMSEPESVVMKFDDGYTIDIKIDESDEKVLHIRGPAAAIEAVMYAFSHFEEP